MAEATSAERHKLFRERASGRTYRELATLYGLSPSGIRYRHRRYIMKARDIMPMDTVRWFKRDRLRAMFGIPDIRDAIWGVDPDVTPSIRGWL